MAFNILTSPGDILIVDDLADNLRVLSDTLSREGHRVRAVRNGPMALVGAKAAPPDVILLDIRMPTMDGFEVCRQLKADAITQHIPIIFLSALDEAVDKARAFEAGGVDYITKPFQADEVQARVRHQLTIQQLRQQVMAQQSQLETLTQSVANQPAPSEFSLRSMTCAANTILACADDLAQNHTLGAEQIPCLQAVQQHGQVICDLLATLEG
ncbi:response regulator [Nodosilinea sp. E11]|uniref:response regulator n=1 Tax=Nodosilinea sp. E11 TaxID=3037479 RepID=UPI00293454ED|nr:response regulator [Nodosilinea sp. E11]WOD40314.1 response regulator [Nodosilinea sp. E11]